MSYFFTREEETKVANEDLKAELKRKRVHHYEVADRLGILDSNFSRMLREELSDEKKKYILRIADEVLQH